MTLGDLLATLVDHVWGLWPFTIVEPWRQAVRLRLGVVTGLCTSTNGFLSTGLHGRWPLIGEFYVEDVNSTVAATREQALTTADGEAVVVSVVFRYRIKDLAVLWTELDDPRTGLVNAVEAEIGDWVPQLFWRCEADDDSDSIHRLDRILDDEVSATFLRWGVELEMLAVHTLCRTRAIRLFTEGRSASDAGAGMRLV